MKKLLNIINKTEAIKEKTREHYKNMSQDEKDKTKEYQKQIKNWFSIKKKH